jgi:hypothetical protein
MNESGGLKKHIKSKHDEQLKYVHHKDGGTLGMDIGTTIKKRKVARDRDLVTMWTNSSQSKADKR